MSLKVDDSRGNDISAMWHGSSAGATGGYILALSARPAPGPFDHRPDLADSRVALDFSEVGDGPGSGSVSPLQLGTDQVALGPADSPLIGFATLHMGLAMVGIVALHASGTRGYRIGILQSVSTETLRRPALR